MTYNQQSIGSVRANKWDAPDYSYSTQIHGFQTPMLIQLTSAEEIANQAYTFVFNYLNIIHQLPKLDVSENSIKELKQIEKKAVSTGGIAKNFLNLIRRIIQAVGNLALFAAAFTTGVCIIPPLLMGLPMASLFALAIGTPAIGALGLIGIASKVMAGALNYLLREKKLALVPAQQQNIQDLKTWINFTQLDLIEQKIRDAKVSNEAAQYSNYCHQGIQDQFGFLSQALVKIGEFRHLERQLNLSLLTGLLTK